MGLECPGIARGGGRRRPSFQENILIIPEASTTVKGHDTETLRILFIGDIFGRSGRRVVARYLAPLKHAYALDMVIANGENSAGGVGISASIVDELLKIGVDVITSGNHLWRHKEVYGFIDSQRSLVRPLNYPSDVPGRGFVVFETDSGGRVAVLNLMGRIFMDPLDSPFQAASRFLDEIRMGQEVDAIVVDMHAEATSEKGAMGYYLDGQVSAVLGTHTHIPTADYRILPRGTAFQTDVGMTGCYQSVIGMQVNTVLPRFLRHLPTRFEPAQEAGALCGTLLVVAKSTGLCQTILPIRLGADISNTGLPDPSR